MASIKYILLVLRHKWYVLTFGLKVGGIPIWRLLVHDFSKFSRAEFPAYRRRYFEGGVSREVWERAWRHHWTHNPHHWEYWVHKSGPMPMPEKFAREMFADWMAANRVYEGVSLQEWLDKNFVRMRLHPETVAVLHRIMPAHGLRIPV